MKRMNRVLAGILAAVFVCSCLPLLVFSDKEINVKERTGKSAADLAGMLDFTLQGDQAPKVISASKLTLDYAGVTLTPAESTYFDSNGVALKYSDVIPASCLTCERTEGGVTVTARSYSFVSASGNEMTYMPVSATLDGTTQYFGSKQTLSFLGLEGGSYEVQVEYSAQISLGAQQTDELFNVCYDMGKSASKSVADYEAAEAAYEKKCEEYAQLYARYLNELSAYNAYVKDYEEYETKLRAYEDYITAKNDYETQLALYQAYLIDKQAYDEAALAYANDYNAYLEANRAYLENVAQFEACRRAMEAFEMVFYLDEYNHKMYSTIIGRTVDEVLENRKRLEEEGGVDKRDIENAGKATDVLRAVLKPYTKLKTEKEKFEYYAEHYEEIKSNFILLFTSLNSLGKNPVVKAVLNNKGRWERYCQFVAHLYVIYSTLDDTKKLDLDWQMQKQSLQTLLSAALIIEDKQCSDPAGLVYPEQELEKPTAPTAPEEIPTVKEPVKTWTVDLTAPAEPPAVSKPDPLIDEANYTGTKPVRPSISEERRALMEEYNAGTLTERETKAIELTVRAYATKQVTYEGMATVRFFDYDRRTLLDSQTVFKNEAEAVVYGKDEPYRPADERNTYRFIGFFDENGNTVALNYLTGDVDLYAVFEETPIDYTVTFSAHGQSETLICHYGDMPEPTLSEESYFEGDVEYRFAGYQPQIARVTGDAAYEAAYDRIEPQRFMITFEDVGMTTMRVCKIGETPEAPDTFGSYKDEEYEYTFVGWEPELSAADADTVYTARYTREPLVPLLAGDGVPRVVSGQTLTVVVPGEDSRLVITRLLRMAADENKAISFKLPDGMTITMECGALDAIGSAYAFSANKTGDDLTFSLTDAEGGDLFAQTEIELILSFPSAVQGEFRIEYKPQSTSDVITVDVTVENNDVRVILPRSGRYGIFRPHTVTVSTGNAAVSAGTAYRGEKIRVYPTVGSESKIASLNLTYDSGATKTVLSDSFEMPDENVTVEVFYEEPPKIEYTVTFYDENGGVLSERTYSYDDELILPDKTPTKPSDEEGYEYDFVGWEPTVSANVIGDVEYRPVFKRVSKEPYESPYDSDQFWSKVFFPKILPIFLAVIAAIGVAIGITIVAVTSFKDKKKKSKKAAENDEISQNDEKSS